MTPLRIVLAISAIAVIYAASILASGAGFNLFGIPWDFSRVGQFGDAFGPLNTLMAGIAAIGAVAAYRSQAKELKRVIADSETERALSAKRDFEITYFNLLKLFRDTVNEIDVLDPYGQNPTSGRDALKVLLEKHIGGSNHNEEINKKVFTSIYIKFRDDLAHYFRLFYQILRYLDESEVNDKGTYKRLLRATLSNAEIVLIALNCVYGGGQEKLKPLVEKYSMLHNISAYDAISWSFNSKFDQGAFGDRNIALEGSVSRD